MLGETDGKGKMSENHNLYASRWSRLPRASRPHIVPHDNRQHRRLKFSIGSTDIALTMNEPLPTATMFQPNGAPSTDDAILTVLDVARFLRVPKSTVYKLVRVGELPGSKIGKHWRFLRHDIHEWLRGRSQQG